MFSAQSEVCDATIIRPCGQADIKQLLQMTRQLGWDCSLFDYMVAISLDPSSILAAVDESDTPLGFIAALNMYESFTYIHSFVVREDKRGRGIGKKLLRYVLDITSERNVCLDAVIDLTDWYRKYGFVHRSFRSNLYSGVVNLQSKEKTKRNNKYDMCPLSEERVQEMLKYDMGVFNQVSRKEILQELLFAECVYTVVALSNGNISGYGCVVEDNAGNFCIKTIIGNNAEVAEEIIGNIIEKIPVGATLTFNLLADKKIPDQLTDCKSDITIQRMFTKFPLETDSDKIFCICCQFI